MKKSDPARLEPGVFHSWQGRADEIVTAHRITAENIEAIAEWCNGSPSTDGFGALAFVDGSGCLMHGFIGDYIYTSVGFDNLYYVEPPMVFEKYHRHIPLISIERQS